jgi:TfoX/Sxy family transcriptional regulator of competence genes
MNPASRDAFRLRVCSSCRLRRCGTLATKSYWSKHQQYGQEDESTTNQAVHPAHA